MTPQERAVIEAARKWGEASQNDCQAEANALAAALRALYADPEPAEAVGETKLRAVSVAITQPSAETAWAMHVVTADGRLLEYSSGRWSQWALPAPATVEPAK